MSNKVNDSHEGWVKRQAEAAGEKAETGRSQLITNSEIKELMRARRAIAANVREPLFGVLCGVAKDDNA